jgi:hypothetical protein
MVGLKPTQIPLACPVEGFEGVTVVFDMLASPSQIDAALNRMGQAGTIKPLIAQVDNWPEEYGEPFGVDTPTAVFVWAIRVGWKGALTAFIVAPNF